MEVSLAVDEQRAPDASPQWWPDAGTADRFPDAAPVPIAETDLQIPPPSDLPFEQLQQLAALLGREAGRQEQATGYLGQAPADVASLASLLALLAMPPTGPQDPVSIFLGDLPGLQAVVDPPDGLGTEAAAVAAAAGVIDGLQQGGVPLLQSYPAFVPPGSIRRAAPKKRRARILKEGQLTMIVYGQDEALLWAKRVATFQQAMREVLGDRRRGFTWSGSIIDSVNVSDFLSSKAFMELASRFPVRKSPQPPVQQQQQQQQQHKQALGQLSQTTDRITAEQMPTESGSAQVGPVLAGAAALETAGEQAQLRLDGRSCACINDVEDTVDWEAVRTAPHEKLADAIKCRGMQFSLAKRIHTFLDAVISHNRKRLSLPSAPLQAKQQQQQLQAWAALKGPAKVPSGVAAGLLQHRLQEGQAAVGLCQQGNVAALVVDGRSDAMDMPVSLLSGPAHESDEPAEQTTWPASHAALPQTVPQPSSSSDAVPGLSALGMADVSAARGAAALLSSSAELPEVQHGTLWTLPASSNSSRRCSVSGEQPCGDSTDSPRMAAVEADNLAVPGAAATTEQPQPDSPATTAIADRSPKRQRTAHPVELQYEVDEGLLPGYQGHIEQDASLQQRQEELSLGDQKGQPGLLSLEWLRDVSDDEARDYLMSVEGLGRKSVACIMLLTLGRKEFPVDTNVGRICARLGWIPLDADQTVEELADYAPEPEVHKLMPFDLETLYELHYQMITLGKVFCSKASPNCRACPMQGDCEYALNNGPSLHGRKRQRQQGPQSPLVAATGTQQAQRGQQATPFSVPQHAEQGCSPVAGPASPLAQARQPRRPHQRSKQGKGDSETEQDALEEAAEDGEDMNLAFPSSKAHTAAAGSRQPRRQHVYAQPVQLGPDDVDLATVLSLVPRQRRTGGPHSCQTQPPGSDKAGASTGHDTGLATAAAVPGPVAERIEDEVERNGGNCPDALGRLAAGSLGAAVEAGRDTAALQVAAQRSVRRRVSFEGGHVTLRRSQRSIRYAASAAAVPGDTDPQPLGYKADAPAADEQPQALGMPHRMVRRSQGPAGAKPGIPDEAAVPGKGSRELWQLLREAPVLQSRVPPRPAAAPALQALPRCSAGGRVLRSQKDKSAAAPAAAAAAEVVMPATGAAPGKATQHHSPSTSPIAPGPGTQRQAAAAAAAVPEPTSPLPTTRSGRAVRHPRRDEFVEEEEALAAVLHVKQEGDAEADGNRGAVGRDGDARPREASPAYLCWVLRHTPRKPRSPCLPPSAAAAAESPAVAASEPAAAADTEPAAAATPDPEEAVPSARELSQLLPPESETVGHILPDEKLQGTGNGILLPQEAREEEPGRQQQQVTARERPTGLHAVGLHPAEEQMPHDGWPVPSLPAQQQGRESCRQQQVEGEEERGEVPEQQQQQRELGAMEGDADSPGGVQGEEPPLRCRVPTDSPQLREGGQQDTGSPLQPKGAIQKGPHKWYKRGPLGAGLKGLAGIPAALRMFQAAAQKASPPAPPAAKMGSAAEALGGAAGGVTGAEAATRVGLVVAADSLSGGEAACGPAGLAASPVLAASHGLRPGCQGQAAASGASGRVPHCPVETLHESVQATTMAGLEATAAPQVAVATAAAAAALPAVAASSVAAPAVGGGSPHSPHPDLDSSSALPGAGPGGSGLKVPAVDVAVECARLVALGEEMEPAQKRLAVAVGNPAAAALHEQRLVELALQAVGVSAALHAGSAHSVLSAARRQYRVLSMKIHPDKCGHPLAPSAFAVLSHAFGILSQAAAAATAATPHHGRAHAAPMGKAAASAGQVAAEDLGQSGHAPPVPAAMASAATATAAADAAAAAPAEGGSSAVETARHDQAPDGTAEPKAGQEGSNAELAADNPQAPALQPGGVGACAGSGPLSAKLAPLPLGEQLVWTHQRRVVQAFVIPPHLLPELPPLEGITGASAAGGAGQPDPLLFVPLAALAGGEGAAGEGRHLSRSPMLPRLALAVVGVGSGGEAAAENSGGENLGECQGSQQQQQHRQTQQVAIEAEFPMPAAAAQPTTAAEVANGTCHAAAAAPGAAVAPTIADTALAAPGAVAEGADDVHEEGVVLVTCRTAMQGRFPLNGTYFQMNEVFVDQATAEAPVKASLKLGYSHTRDMPTFFYYAIGDPWNACIHYMAKGMTQQEVANMFGHGHVCFRAYDPLTGAPLPLPAFLAPSVPKTAPSNWKPKAALRAAERAARAAAAQHAQQQQERYPWLPAYPPVLDPLRLVAVPSDAEAFAAPPAVVPHDAWPWHSQQENVGLQLDSLVLTPAKRPGRLCADGSPDVAKRHKAATPRVNGSPGAGAVDGSVAGRKRVQEFPIIRRGDRCGWCHTCLNPRLKKACLTRRKEMEAATAGHL
ncbi:hypothetical protein N2152v2_009604 [Parachlorella kessleri]